MVSCSRGEDDEVVVVVFMKELVGYEYTKLRNGCPEF